MARLNHDYGYELTLHKSSSWTANLSQLKKACPELDVGAHPTSSVFLTSYAGTRGDYWNRTSTWTSRINRYFLANQLAKHLRAFSSAEFGINKHFDVINNAEEIEFNSPPLRTTEDLEKFYREFRRIASALGLKPHHEKHMSGGGHLHVTPISGRWDKNFVADVYRDISNRPYLNWIFNDPSDDWNASCLGKAIEFDSKLNDSTFNWTNKRDFPEFSKDYAMSYRSNKNHTMEFRFFDAPKDWTEQLLHIVFIERYLNWMMKKFMKGRRTEREIVFEHQIERMTYKESVSEFNDLLRSIRLEPELYRRFLVNMKTRYEEKWKRD